jgi:hypothetical protein
MLTEIKKDTLVGLFPKTSSAIGLQKISENKIQFDRRYHFRHNSGNDLSLMLQKGHIPKIDIRYAKDDGKLSADHILFSSAAEGRVHYSIYTDGSIFKGLGSAFFTEAFYYFAYFVPQVSSVIGDWRYPGETNYEAYWQAIEAGSKPEAAAQKTWTYKQTEKLSLKKVTQTWGDKNPQDRGPVSFLFSR